MAGGMLLNILALKINLKSMIFFLKILNAFFLVIELILTVLWSNILFQYIYVFLNFFFIGNKHLFSFY